MSRVKSNPLSTRFVQPGRIAWYAADSSRSLDALVDYFTRQLNCRAAIVGPHGSGKSTLLAHIVPLLGVVIAKRAAYVSDPQVPEGDAPLAARIGKIDKSIVWLQMRSRTASARLLQETRGQWCQPNRLLVIDGYEQLSMLARARLVWGTRNGGVGLLVTSHRRTSLPTLIETKVDARLAQQLLERLLPEDLPSRAALLNSDRLNGLLARNHGNLREVFMQLYDELE